MSVCDPVCVTEPWDGFDFHPLVTCPVCGIQFFAEQATRRHPGQEHP